MAEGDQAHICYFIEGSCVVGHHERCDEVWEGASIKAICKCSCHSKIKDNELSTGVSKQLSKEDNPSSKNSVSQYGVRPSPR